MRWLFERDVWMICTSCSYINVVDTRVCKLCGDATQPISLSQDRKFVLKAGIKACYTCNAFFLELLARQATQCPTCQRTLSLVTYKDNYLPLLSETPVFSEPCSKCSFKQSINTHFCDVCGKLNWLIIDYSTTRPTTAIFLRKEKLSLKCDVLFDLGADANTFHMHYADLLGIDLSFSPTAQIQNSYASGTSYLAYVEVGIVGIPEIPKYYCLPIYFTDALPNNFYNMFGMHGFFDRFKMESHGQGTIVLRELDEFPRKTYDRCPLCITPRLSPESNFCILCGNSLVVQSSDKTIETIK